MLTMYHVKCTQYKSNLQFYSKILKLLKNKAINSNYIYWYNCIKQFLNSYLLCCYLRPLFGKIWHPVG